jgi:hypothetical protein
MTYANMIYLALLTERVPIVGPFTRSPHTGPIEPFPFGDVFDVPRLRRTLRVPILEWRDVKDPASPVLDDIGCWSIWMTVQNQDNSPRGSPTPSDLKLGELLRISIESRSSSVHQPRYFVYTRSLVHQIISWHRRIA